MLSKAKIAELNRALSDLRTRSERTCYACGVSVPAGTAFTYYCPDQYKSDSMEKVVTSFIASGGGDVNLALDVGALCLCDKCRKKLAVTCNICGMSMHVHSVGQVNLTEEKRSKYICPACIHVTGSVVCTQCLSPIKKGQEHLIVSADGEKYPYCGVCFDKSKDDVTKCHDCGLLVWKSSSQKIHRVLHTPKKKREYFTSVDYCPSCEKKQRAGNKKYSCPSCKRRVAVEDTVTIDDLVGKEFNRYDLLESMRAIGLSTSVKYCRICAKKLKARCSRCGAPIVSLNSLCRTCTAGGTGHINNYHFDPEFVFKGKAPFYGLEIETTGFATKKDQIMTSDEVFNGVGKKGAAIYQKRDSSIGDHGIEFCFQPRSIDEWFNASGTRLLTAFRNVITAHGGYSYKSGLCGLHIHRSRDDLATKVGKTKTPAGYVRWLTAVSSVELYALVLAQRSGANATINRAGNKYTVNDYGSFSYVKELVGEHEVDEEGIIDWYKRASANIPLLEHRGALNIPQHTKTVEYRFFRGTLCVDTILAYIAFAHMLAEWSKVVNLATIKRANQTTAWDMFCKYAFSEFGEERWCKHFMDYCKEKKVVS